MQKMRLEPDMPQSTSEQVALNTYSSKSVLLQAGAGAGKTTTLTQTLMATMLQFKAKHQRWPKVIVTTFTRKATQELKERLQHLALEIEQPEIFEVLAQPKQVHISTIHGVLGLYLDQFGNLMGLSPDKKIISEPDAHRIYRSLLFQIFEEQSEFSELLETFSYSDLSSILDRMSEQSMIHPLQRLSAEDLKKEIAEILKEKYSNVIVWAEEALKMNDLPLGWIEIAQKWQTQAKAILKDPNTDFQKLTAGFEIFAAEKVPRKKGSDLEITEEDEPRRTFTAIRKEAKSITEDQDYSSQYFADYERVSLLLEKLSDQFSKLLWDHKVSRRVMTMSDLESFSVKLAREHPSSALEFSSKWDYWMIDEYQDTSPLQEGILNSLIGESAAFVVGDPQQSIYLFRGARSEVFARKSDEFKAQNKLVDFKAVNYRSTPEVLAAINETFVVKAPRFSKMEAGKGSDTSKLVADVNLISYGDEDQHLGYDKVALFVKQLLLQGVTPSQIAILGRSHTSIAEAMKHLKLEKIAYRVQGKSNFSNRREVLDVLQFLKFLLNPHDNANLFGLLRSPWFFVEEENLITLGSLYKNSLWTYLLSVKTAKNPWSKVVDLLNGFRQQAREIGYAATTRNFVLQEGLLQMSLYWDDSGQAEANLWKLLSNLSQLEKQPGKTFHEYIQNTIDQALSEEGESEKEGTPVLEPDRVQLMTVHASKGLQFEHVIVLDASKGNQTSKSGMWQLNEADHRWSIKIKNEDEEWVGHLWISEVSAALRRREKEESERVLYVAMTRAKKSISFLCERVPSDNTWCALLPPQWFSETFESSDYKLAWLHEVTAAKSDLLGKSADLKPLLAFVGNQKPNIEKIKASDQSISAGESRSSTKIPEALQRAQRGTEAHRVFEAIKYGEVEMEDPELVKAIDYIRSEKKFDLAKIIDQGHPEWGFAVKKGEGILRGQIDLWAMIDGEIYVVDYKTGSQKFSDAAFEQLKIYAWAVMQIKLTEEQKKTTKVHALVVYPFQEEVKFQSSWDWNSLNA